jgi:hypothetical protein
VTAGNSGSAQSLVEEKTIAKIIIAFFSIQLDV